MPRLLVLPPASGAWPEIEGDERAILDPSRGPEWPSSVALIRRERTSLSRFFGYADVLHAPHLWLGLVAEIAERAGGDAAFLCPPLPDTVRGRETFDALLRVVRPASALVPSEAWRKGFGLVAEVLPPGEQKADLAALGRAAKWLRLVDAEHVRRVDPRQHRTIGSILGARTVGEDERLRAGIAHGTIAVIDGTRLHTIADRWPDEREITRATLALRVKNHTAHLAAEFVGTVGVLERGREEVGHVRLERLDADGLTLRSTADPEAPFDRLRLGRLRIDGSGREITR